MHFQHGIEQELQIVDPSDKQLLNKRHILIPHVTDTWSYPASAFAGFGPDGYESQIEYWVGIFDSLQSLKEELFRFRKHIIDCARDKNVGIIACGVNPITETRTDGENFGEHHHIGIRSAQEAIDYYNLVRQFIPELIALSANSPVYNSIKTGFMSYRMKRTKHTAFPEPMRRSEWNKIIEYSHSAEPDSSLRYLDITPFVTKGRTTVEVRLFDCQYSLEKSINFALILQSLLLKLRGISQNYLSQLESPSAISEQKLIENRDIAIREGLESYFDFSKRPILNLDNNVNTHDALQKFLFWLDPELKKVSKQANISDEIMESLLYDKSTELLFQKINSGDIDSYTALLANLSERG